MHCSCYAFLLLFLSVAYAQYPPERNCNNTQFECEDGGCIDKRRWCGNYYRSGTCRDGSNFKNCRQYYPNCLLNQSYCSENRKCIPEAWVCDGYKDCPAGSDEAECLSEGYRIKDIPGVKISRRKAKSWLLEKRRDWGWKKDTARVIVSIYLSNVTEFSAGSCSSELMIKQLKLQLSDFLLRNNSQPVSTHQLAMFVNALLVICQDPRNFFGFNLVDELHQRVKRSSSLNPFFALALCNANETISDGHIAQLLELYFNRLKLERVDSVALAAMTLRCLQRRYDNHIKPSVDAIYNRTSDFESSNFLCQGLQLEDGSYGSIYSTALLLQAILTVPYEMREGCNIVDAISFLVSKQEENGAFNDIMSTYLVLPLLYGRTLVDLGHVKCKKSSSDLTVQEEFDAKNTDKQNVEYSIQVGNQDVAFSMNMRVPVNVTFFDVMRLAAELDPRYRFKYVSYPWGKLTYSIFDIVNDPEARKYWQLYRVTDEEKIYLEQSPDKIIPKDEENYMYWYKPTD